MEREIWKYRCNVSGEQFPGGGKWLEISAFGEEDAKRVGYCAVNNKYNGRRYPKDVQVYKPKQS